jgi:hypothetical protein
MTCLTVNGEHAVKSDNENGDPSPHFSCQIDPAINIDQNKVVEEHVEEKGEGKELPELRGRDRGRPPVLKKKKSSYDLRDIFQTQEAASSSVSSSSVTSNVSSPVIPSPDLNKFVSPDEIITAPAQQQQTSPPNRESSSNPSIPSLMTQDDSRPHDKNVPEDKAQDAST